MLKKRIKFGEKVVSMKGVGRGRIIALFDYSSVPSGHLVCKRTSADINRGGTIPGLTERETAIVRRWVSPPKGGTSMSHASDHEYPTADWVLAQFAKHSTMSVNEDGDISHPDVTKAYVDKFCQMNHFAA